MAEKKKTTKIAVNDVAPANKTAAEPSSKPILVTNRPIMKDPMVVEGKKEAPTEDDTELAKVAAKPDLHPAKPEPEPEPEKADAVKPDEPAKPTVAETEDAEAAKQAEHDAAVQKLIDDKQYFLPINAVEKRRSQRFVLLGIVLSLVLAVAWADVALDAGIIHINGIKPATHFFSN